MLLARFGYAPVLLGIAGFALTIAVLCRILMAPRRASGAVSQIATGAVTDLRKRSRTCTSCSLRLARTRICRTIVPEMRGEKLSGALWQREQFCANTRCPSSSV